MPTILIKKSDTPGSVPGTANLTNLAGGAEVAVNTADRRMYSMNSSSAVVELGTNPSSLTCADGSFTLLKAASASITNLTATSLVLSNLSIASANVTTLTSASATITNLLATSLTVSGNTFLATSSGNVGIGTSSPAAKLDVAGTIRATGGPVDSIYTGTTAGSVLGSFRAYGTGASVTGETLIRGVLESGSITSSYLEFGTASSGTLSEKMRLTSSGNLGLGVTPSAWGSTHKAIQVGGGAACLWAGASAGSNAYFSSNVYFDGSARRYVNTAAAAEYNQNAGAHSWYTAASGTAGNTISFTQAMTLDASGNLGVGTASPTAILDVTNPGTNGRSIRFSPSTGNDVYIDARGKGSEATNTNLILRSYGQSSEGNIIFNTGLNYSVSERARITSGGDFLVRKTASGLSNVGFEVRQVDANTPVIQMTTPGYWTATFNRQTDDGDIVLFCQADTQEGSISVSGNTVSYNAFAGSHWSQLQDGSKPDILRGTVMESINELCEWPDETNERLPKSKISDTAGSKKVYGVFMAWDNDWTATNDMYVTAVGAFICRVNGSVTVQEGDLLESNGDGTARVQADDIIRSSTIGKVTSTVKTHQYDDGSYCVPTVLYCG